MAIRLNYKWEICTTCVDVTSVVSFLLLEFQVEIFDKERQTNKIHQPPDSKQTKGEEVGEGPARSMQVPVMKTQEAEREGQNVGVVGVGTSVKKRCFREICITSTEYIYSFNGN